MFNDEAMILRKKFSSSGILCLKLFHLFFINFTIAKFSSTFLSEERGERMSEFVEQTMRIWDFHAACTRLTHSQMFNV